MARPSWRRKRPAMRERLLEWRCAQGDPSPRRNGRPCGAHNKSLTRSKPSGRYLLVFPLPDSSDPCRTVSSDPRLLLDGTNLASFASAVSEIALPSTYNEPTVMWRMRHRDGRDGQAVIDPTNGVAQALWFVNGHPLGARSFADWTGALEWTDQLQAQQWAVGWRLLDDITADPPQGTARR